MKDLPCSGLTSTMFPSTRDANRTLTAKEAQLSIYAKSLCGPCPNKKDCLNDAIARKERFGVWGGVDFGCRQERNKVVAV